MFTSMLQKPRMFQNRTLLYPGPIPGSLIRTFLFFPIQAGIETSSLARQSCGPTVRCFWVLLISEWNEEHSPFRMLFLHQRPHLQGGSEAVRQMRGNKSLLIWFWD
ncbi:MAG: hypothetical protein A2Y79_07175 [Deltaproteobacteria bacterium RBG_13_43_22]|nr:MAG: hypothetical protein A2Y79_07175 [Deltaproteobacteria bacterium RBG_13_43_22]